MTEHIGEIRISHNNRDITIPYKLYNMWGKIFIKFTDKKGVFYSFYYSSEEQIWKRDIVQCPEWPTDFSQKFFRELDKERFRHGFK